MARPSEDVHFPMECTGPVLPVGYSRVPPGHLAAVVTSLEMRQRPDLRSSRPFPAGVRLHDLGRPSLDRYRALYRTVGQDWLWSSRLIMSDDELRSIIDDPRVQIFALRDDAGDAGILELDFRQPNACELAFFGLVHRAIGKGIGRSLMHEALERAWSEPIERFWLHTCTLDHPAALAFYTRVGFSPYAFQVEVLSDPRLTDSVPRQAAPHIPLLDHGRTG